MKSYNYLPAGTITITTTGNIAQLDPQGCGVVLMNNATLSTIQGIKAGVPGQRVTIVSIGAGRVDLSNQDAGAAAADRLINPTTTTMSLASGVDSGATYIYDEVTARWRQENVTGVSVYPGAIPAPGAGSISNNAANGLFLQSITGSTLDFDLTNPAGTSIILVPTGTLNLQFGGSFLSNTGWGAPAPGAATANATFGGFGGSPNSGSLSFGDNSGWKWTIGTNSSGTFTPRVTFMDTGPVGIGVTDPAGTYGATLVTHAGTNINFSVRTLAGIAGTGSGVGLDAVTDGAAGVTKMGFRATEFQFLSGLFTKYNSINTAGIGVPAIYAYARLTGQTTNITICSYTPSADGEFMANAHAIATSGTGVTGNLTIGYTDPDINTAVSANIGGINTGEPSFASPISFRAKAGVAITWTTTGVGGSSPVYAVTAWISQIGA